MNGRFPNIFLLRYPRMTPESTELWRKFLLDHKDEYTSFDYDVRVGQGVNPGPGFAPELQNDFVQLTQKRIDVIGYNNFLITLFEIKPRGGLSAVGQLLGYKQLYEQSFPGKLVHKLILITGSANQDDLNVYKANNIQCFVYP
jgi:hypothetical protein